MKKYTVQEAIQMALKNLEFAKGCNGIAILDSDFLNETLEALYQANNAIHAGDKCVGTVEYMPGVKGFTMVVFNADDVPAGTYVFTHK